MSGGSKGPCLLHNPSNSRPFRPERSTCSIMLPPAHCCTQPMTPATQGPAPHPHPPGRGKRASSTPAATAAAACSAPTAAGNTAPSGSTALADCRSAHTSSGRPCREYRRRQEATQHQELHVGRHRATLHAHSPRGGVRATTAQQCLLPNSKPNDTCDSSHAGTLHAWVAPAIFPPTQRKHAPPPRIAPHQRLRRPQHQAGGVRRAACVHPEQPPAQVGRHGAGRRGTRAGGRLEVLSLRGCGSGAAPGPLWVRRSLAALANAPAPAAPFATLHTQPSTLALSPTWA